ncbi:MAG: metal ABC transporter substrate-binding protein [Eubacteriales bacterium]|nr:metal ABC transporter substrate-binding protein [Eubacteriales bacterium]
MKKIMAIILSVCLAVLGLAACSSNKNDTSGADNTASQNEKISVVATIFPAYDWVKQIVGDSDKIDLTLLFDSGTDLHNFQPTADDIITISNCDMFIYVGGISDEWVNDALDQAVNKNMVVVDLMDVLGDSVKTEEHKEGMEEEDHEEHEDGEEEIEYDEHIWLSLKNAQVLCNYIGEKLSSIDSENADKYTVNTQSYVSSLSSLDAKYQQAVDSSTNKTLLFGDRFPFRYMVDDYRLDYYAAFAGCSAESEASFETVSFLADKVDELGLKYVITIEGTTHNIAQTIIDNTADKNQQVLTLDSMQSKTLESAQNGETYLSIMESNLSVLQQALA